MAELAIIEIISSPLQRLGAKHISKGRSAAPCSPLLDNGPKPHVSSCTGSMDKKQFQKAPER
jgi:hypothetical protein